MQNGATMTIEAPPRESAARRATSAFSELPPPVLALGVAVAALTGGPVAIDVAGRLYAAFGPDAVDAARRLLGLVRSVDRGFAATVASMIPAFGLVRGSKDEAAARVAIVTDSVAGLPEQACADLGIRVVPLSVEVDGKIYRDGVDLHPDEFYELMKTSRHVPTTSQPSPGAFLEVYEELGADHDRVVYFALSSRLSGTYNSGLQAAEMYAESSGRDIVEVFDTLTAAAPEGLLVSGAVRALHDTGDYDAMMRAAEWLRPRVRMFGTLETLEYLVRGGRVPRVAGMFSGALGLKPMIKIEDGEVQRAGIARSMRRGMSAMLQRIADELGEAGSNAELHAAVMHAACPELGEELKHELEDRFNPIESYLVPMTPVMGAHTGPGLIGIGYYVSIGPPPTESR